MAILWAHIIILQDYGGKTDKRSDMGYTSTLITEMNKKLAIVLLCLPWPHIETSVQWISYLKLDFRGLLLKRSLDTYRSSMNAQNRLTELPLLYSDQRSKLHVTSCDSKGLHLQAPLPVESTVDHR